MASIKQIQVNNTTYDINDKDNVLLYKQEDDDTIYTDSSYTTELSVGSFQTLLVAQGKKKLWVVSNGFGASPALYAYGLDQNDNLESAGIRFIGMEGLTEILTYVALDTSDPSNTFSCTHESVGEDVFDFIYNVEIYQGQTSSEAHLQVTGPYSIMINDAVAEAIASGDSSQIEHIWLMMLAMMTGISGEGSGLGHKKFSFGLTDADDPDGIGLRGVSAYMSVYMKAVYDPNDDDLGSLEYSVITEPFYNPIESKWQTARFELSQTQDLVEMLRFDVTLEDFSGTVELYAEAPDYTQYPDIEGYYVLNPAVTMSSIKQAMEDGKIVRLNFTDPNSNAWSHLDLVDFYEDANSKQLFYTSPYQITVGGNFITAVIEPNNVAYTSTFESLVQFAFPTVSYAASAGSATAATYAANADSVYGKIWYATCDTAAATAAKVATVQRNAGTFSLQTGTVVFVNFTYANSNGGPTLNINSTGAYEVRYYAGSSGGSSQAMLLANGSQILAGVNIFMFDGTYWVLISTNSDYEVYQQNTTTSSSYRVLLSGAANNTSSTTTARKSTNLQFNPSTAALSVGNGTSTGSVSANTVTLGTSIQTPKVLAPTTSGGSTYGAGTSGQVLTSNGTTSYWGNLPSNEPVILYPVYDDNDDCWYAADVNDTVYTQAQLLTLFNAGNTFAICDKGWLESYDSTTIPMNVVEDLSSAYGEPAYAIATSYSANNFASWSDNDELQGYCFYIEFFESSSNAIISHLVTSDNRVNQVSTSSSNNYRVLLSYAANDTTYTGYVNKSSGLTFNPSSGVLSVSGYVDAPFYAIGQSGSLEEVNQSGISLSSRGTITIDAGQGGDDISISGDDLFIMAGSDFEAGYSSVNEICANSGGVTLFTDYNEVRLDSNDYGVHITADADSDGWVEMAVTSSGTPSGYVSIDETSTITMHGSGIVLTATGGAYYNNSEIATQSWVTTQVIGAIGGSY